jgi:hypothetical protein
MRHLAVEKILAFIYSQSLGNTIGWSVFHGVFGPIYLIYSLIVHIIF